MLRLHAILIQAYDDEYEALAIAGQVGLLKADIERHPKLRLTWWSILEESAKEGRLRRLMDRALHDPTIATWHEQLRAVIGVPSGPLLPHSTLEKVPRTAKERRQAALRPEVGAQAKLWDVGIELGVRFLNGSSALKAKVETAAMQWVEYANLKFSFGDDPLAPIRIAFDRPGSWAYQGKDALTVPDSEPTVNFEWLTNNSSREDVEQVVLHEFGHVLGFQHEHGNPASTIEWNKPKVYETMAGPPNNWSRAVVDSNVFAIWPPGYFPVHKVFDRDSIMMFRMPPEFFLAAEAIGENQKLSPLDKQFAAALYPLWSRSQE